VISPVLEPSRSATAPIVVPVMFSSLWLTMIRLPSLRELLSSYGDITIRSRISAQSVTP
jgi:hypothetical protein